MIIDWTVSYYFAQDKSSSKIIFEIPLMMTHEKVYVEQSLEYDSDEYCIVIVDALAFLNCWGNSGNDDRFPNYHLVGNRELWKNDEKFGIANYLFSMGRKKPAPLHIDGVVLNENFQIRLGNSAEQIFWLLYHNAEYIPISVSTRKMANGFKMLMNRNPCSIYSFSELRKFYETEPAVYVPQWI